MIVMLVYPGVMAMDMFGPLEAFATANHAAGRSLYRLEIGGMTKTPVATSLGGIEITPTVALDDIAGPIDTLLVSGGFGQIRIDAARCLFEEAQWSVQSWPRAAALNPPTTCAALSSAAWA